MPTIVVTHSRRDNTAVHIFQNFGEDVWRAFRDDKRVEVSIDEIDRAIDMFSVKTRNRLIGRTIQHIEGIMRRHNLDKACSISVKDCA